MKSQEVLQYGQGDTDYLCKVFQTVEEVIMESDSMESCVGFFQSQASQYAQLWESTLGQPDGPPPMPECMKVYLPKEDEEADLEEENTEFPTFNKLVQELVMIQKLLSKTP